jgi:23S rRNA pseudouridine1911/1915/1917 synthase
MRVHEQDHLAIGAFTQAQGQPVAGIHHADQMAALGQGQCRTTETTAVTSAADDCNHHDSQASHDQNAENDDKNLESLHAFGPVSQAMAHDPQENATAEQPPPMTVKAEESGERLDRFLARRLAGFSRSRLKNLIEAGHVNAGGATLSDPSHRVKPGQTFTLVLPQTVSAKPEGQAMSLAIVYEDDDLIVVDKPAGMVVHPAPGNPDRTLVNALIAHCGASLSGIGGERRPGIVHRLDKDTSGLIVAAKNDLAHRALAADFAARRIERLYQAVVWGIPVPREGEIEGAIGRHPVNRKRMAVVKRGGKSALTRYRVIRALGPGASLVQCQLATGRTHQIRVHLAAAGYPLLGDPVYGRETAERRSRLSAAGRAALAGFHRQALHAGTLGFSHPRTGERLHFESALPADLHNLIKALETKGD